MAIYKPARRNSAPTHRKLRDLTAASQKDTTDELRVLACVHGPGNVPSLISLIESSRSTKKSLVKLFVMHLVELTERSSAIIMVQRARRNGFPFFNRFRRGEWHDPLAGAFQAYSQLGRVKVRPTTAISALSTMHEDICHVAEDKRVTLIILPFHKQWRGEDGETVENVGHGWRGVNQRVLKNAPCSVAVFVDRGLGNGAQTPVPTTTAAQRVCVIFFGGPDDREALALGGRMAEHPAIKVTVIRFVEKEGKGSKDMMLRLSSTTKYSEHNYSFSTAKMDRENERELDETTVAEFRSKWGGIVEYSDRVANNNIVEGVLAIGRSREYELIVVGKGRFPSTMVAGLAGRHAENAELGPIGDILTSCGNGVVSSVLVIQQHDLAHAEEAPVSNIVTHANNSTTHGHDHEVSSSVREITKDLV